VEELILPDIEGTWGNVVRQIEIHTAGPLEPEPSASDFEVAIEKLKSYKSPGIDQISAELIKAGDKTICSEINLLFLFEIRRNFLRSESSRS